MTNECDLGGCCSLPTERADFASSAAGSAARRGSRRRGASSLCALSDRTDGNLCPVEGLRHGAVGAAWAGGGQSDGAERRGTLRLRA